MKRGVSKPITPDSLRRWPCQSCGYDLSGAVRHSKGGAVRCSECGVETTLESLYRALTSTHFAVSIGWTLLALLPGPVGGVLAGLIAADVIPLEDRLVFEMTLLGVLYMAVLAGFATRFAPSKRIQAGRAALLTVVLFAGNLAFYSLSLWLTTVVAMALMGSGG